MGIKVEAMAEVTTISNTLLADWSVCEEVCLFCLGGLFGIWR